MTVRMLSFPLTMSPPSNTISAFQPERQGYLDRIGGVGGTSQKRGPGHGRVQHSRVG
jgi:hypothetical protein